MVAMLMIVSVGGLRMSQNPSDARKSLENIFEETGTDKLWRHGYHRYYESKLAPYRDIDGLRILEIGAEKGKSLRTWTEYFSKPAAIHGIAYGADPVAARNEACKAVGDEKCKYVNIFALDQSDTEALGKLCQEEPDGWHLIIDDGSHLPRHQLISFQALFPHLKPGGLYVIEDIESSYVDDGSKIYGYPIVGGGIAKAPPGNAIEKFKQIVDVVNRQHFGHPEISVMDGVDKDVAEVSFGDGLIFVHKKPDDAQWNKYPNSLSGYNQREHSDKSVKQWLAARQNEALSHPSGTSSHKSRTGSGATGHGGP